ncbi:hypothetical protein ATCC90586_010759 [Pythium insidiosum]|nr:hypothetical protein ATCC90586_010759 [Pythium insidiosum]
MVPSTSAELLLALRDVVAMPELVGCPLVVLALRTIVCKTSDAPSPQIGSVLSPRQEAQALEHTTVSFEQFLALLSLFSVKQSVDIKRRDQDGAISSADAVKTLRAISPATSLLSHAQLQAVVSSTLGLHDAAASLSPVDFHQRLTDTEVTEAMTIAF